MAEFDESKHPRDKDGKFTDKGKGIKDNDNFEERHYLFIKQSGAISGAESGALDSNSKEAREHAKRYYDFLRTTNSDIDAIAKNTGISKEDIAKIKNYLFVDKHNLSSGYKRFYPDYNIAVSWQRLAEGKNIKHMDYVLLNHELEEMRYIEMGYTQQEAHDMANKRFNYQELVEKERKNGNHKKRKNK